MKNTTDNNSLNLKILISTKHLITSYKGINSYTMVNKTYLLQVLDLLSTSQVMLSHFFIALYILFIPHVNSMYHNISKKILH